MTEQRLEEILERSADRVSVGPAPVGVMVGEAARTRRRRTVSAVLAGATAVVAVAVTSTVLSSPDEASKLPPVSSPAATTPPAGMRFVGVGHAAILIPEDWGTNETRCGTPQEDTIVIDDPVTDLCLTRRPDKVESVELSTGGQRFDFTADHEITIDGVVADRQVTTCQSDVGSREVCNGAVFIPSLKVSFRAESSTGPAEVDRILEQIRVLPDLVAVPGFESLNIGGHDRSARYQRKLEVAGLAVEARTVKRKGWPGGYLAEVAPPVGTMVAPGTSVLVSVTAPARR